MLGMVPAGAQVAGELREGGCCLGRHRLPGQARLQPVRLGEDPLQGLAVPGLDQLLDAQLDPARDGVGPVGDDQEALEVAGDEQRRVVEGQGILLKLCQSGVEVGTLALVLPGEVAFLPDVAPAAPARGLDRPLLEAVVGTAHIDIGGLGLVQQLAHVEEMRLGGLTLAQRRELPTRDEGIGSHRPAGRQTRLCLPASHASSPYGGLTRDLPAKRKTCACRGQAQVSAILIDGGPARRSRERGLTGAMRADRTGGRRSAGLRGCAGA